MGNAEQPVPAEPLRHVEPCALVIIGATGDLAQRKLAPALWSLYRLGQLPDPFVILGGGRRERSDDSYRQLFRQALAHDGTHVDDAAWNAFAGRLFYVSGDFTQSNAFGAVADRLKHCADRIGHRLFYLAVPADEFEPIVHAIGRSGLAPGDGAYARVIVEKPVGRDLESARRLDRALGQVFGETNCFRIDHYLGKETVQNLMVLRFANSIFELMWNREHVDHVQITVAESLGVEGRAAFYEQTGILRDVAQNHLMQLLTLVAMEPPAAGSPDGVREEKVKVLRSLRRLTPQDVVAGQYQAGPVDGNDVPAYRSEPGVAEDSTTDTFFAARLFVDNWRWAGVPFYVRCGKRLPRKLTEVVIQFQRPPIALFRVLGCTDEQPNRLVVRIQPDEGISMDFGAKVPGPKLCIEPVSMDFHYRTVFNRPLPDAYQRLLLDVMAGDTSLFLRQDEVEAAWAVYQPILDAWSSDPVNKRLAFYPAGSWGPGQADRLLIDPAHKWRAE